MSVRLPIEAVQAIAAMSNAERSTYRIVRDIILAHMEAARRPPLRGETVELLHRIASEASYDSADVLVTDLCLAFERCLLQARGELNEEEVVNVDIADMFDAITDKRLLSNEEGVRIRKHT